MRLGCVVLACTAWLTGCATHTTRSTMQISAGEAPRVVATRAFEAMGYAPTREPPTTDPKVRDNVLRAWRWWPGSRWWSRGSGLYVRNEISDPVTPVLAALYWTRPRRDGGWDQLALSIFRGHSGADIWSGQPYASWQRWVVTAGTFGPDGRERWPSHEVRSDADSVITLVRNASEHPRRAGPELARQPGP